MGNLALVLKSEGRNAEAEAQSRELLAAEANGRAWRLIGAGLSDFVDAAEGLDLFADEERRARSSEQAIDALRDRFGADAVVSGRSLKPHRP